MSNKLDSTTDAELEAEYIERNNNLKRTWNNIIDKVDHVARSTHDYLEAPELRAEVDHSIPAGAAAAGHRGNNFGAFKASSSNYENHTIDSEFDYQNAYRNNPHVVNNRTYGVYYGPSEVGYVETEIDLVESRSDTLGVHDGTRRRSSFIGERTSRPHQQTGWGLNLMDRTLMNSIYRDIHAMHSTNPEEFEGVASKIDETFGSNALS